LHSKGTSPKRVKLIYNENPLDNLNPVEEAEA